METPIAQMPPAEALFTILVRYLFQIPLMWCVTRAAGDGAMSVVVMRLRASGELDAAFGRQTGRQFFLYHVPVHFVATRGVLLA